MIAVNLVLTPKAKVNVMIDNHMKQYFMLLWLVSEIEISYNKIWNNVKTISNHYDLWSI